MSGRVSLSLAVMLLASCERAATAQLPQCVPSTIDQSSVVINLPASVPDTVTRVVWTIDDDVVEASTGRILRLERAPEERIGFTASAATLDGIGLCSLAVALEASHYQPPKESISSFGSLSSAMTYGIAKRRTQPQQTVTINYVTERQPDQELTGSFTNKRSSDGNLRYGRAEVVMPVEHKALFRTNPTYWSFDENDFVARYHSISSDALFFQQLQVDLRQPGPGKKKLLVFVHGFNNSFHEEVYKLADLVHETSFSGSPILFDWPSLALSALQEVDPARLVQAYDTDNSQVLQSVDHLADLLLRLSREGADSDVDVVAHSMGNKLLLLALKKLSDTGHIPRLNQVIMAAPDVTQPYFNQVIPAFIASGAVRRVTVYGTTKDKAMRLSKHENTEAPLGMLPPLLEVNGVDQVDASRVSMNFLGHDYFVTTRPMLDDMAALLGSGDAPASRHGLIAAHQGTYAYWVLTPIP